MLWILIHHEARPGKYSLAYISARICTALYGEIIQALVVGGDSPIEVGLLANYVAGSVLSSIKWWLDNDMPRSPEYMAAVWKQMIQPSMMGVVMLDDDWYEQE